MTTTDHSLLRGPPTSTQGTGPPVDRPALAGHDPHPRTRHGHAPRADPGTCPHGTAHVRGRLDDDEAEGRARRARRRRGVDGPVAAGPAADAGAARPAARGRRRSGLSVSGFDYEVSSRVEVDVRPHEPGRVLVPGRLLADIVRALPAAAGRPARSRAAAWCSPAAPPASRCRRCRSRTTRRCRRCRRRPAPLDSDVFAAAVAQVAVAAGRDDTLPMLTGVRVEIEGETAHPRRDRPLPAGGAHAALAARDARRCRPRRWSRPARWPTPPRRSTGRPRGDPRAVHRRAPARA